MGSTLDRASVTLRGVPEGSVSRRRLLTLEDVLERPVISAIQADEPVVEARIAVKGSGGGLGSSDSAGHARRFGTCQRRGGRRRLRAAGYAGRCAGHQQPANRAETETQTVLQNITVLSAGQTIQTDGKSQPIVAPVVTLLVTPAEAEAHPRQRRRPHSTGAAQFHRPGEVATRGPQAARTLRLRGAKRPMRVGLRAPARSRRARPPCLPVSAQMGSRRAASALPAPAAEPEQMIVIRGAVKKVEVFQ